MVHEHMSRKTEGKTSRELLQLMRVTVYLLCTMIFAIGYIVTFYRLEEVWLEYLLLSVLSMFACWLLLAHLHTQNQFVFPVWIIFLVFLIGYYFKFYLLAFNPLLGARRSSMLSQLAASEEVLIESYRIVTVAFVVFCIIACMIMKRQNIHKHKRFLLQRELMNANWVGMSLCVFFISIVLMIVTNAIIYVTGIAVMGAPPVYLPYRLAGVVFYTTVVIIPSLFVLLVWSTDREDLQRWFLLALILVFLFVMMRCLPRSTRGYLLVLFILLLFVFVLSDRLTWRRVMLGGVVGVSVVALFRPMTVYRGALISHPELGIGGAMWRSFNSISEAGLWNNVINGFIDVFFRMTGVESLMMMIGGGFQALGTGGIGSLFIFGGPGLARLFTSRIEGIAEHMIHLSAPSFLGAFYMVGGMVFTTLGVVVFTVIVWAVWTLILRLNLRCSPVAQAMFLMLVVSLVMDGELDRFVWPVISTTAGIMLCEFIMRTVGTGEWFPGRYQVIQAGATRV